MQSPDYGTISTLFDNPQPGDTVRFTCDDGYELLGSEVRTCLETDVWSGEAVSCQGSYNGNLYMRPNLQKGVLRTSTQFFKFKVT